MFTSLSIGTTIPAKVKGIFALVLNIVKSCSKLMAYLAGVLLLWQAVYIDLMVLLPTLDLWWACHGFIASWFPAVPARVVTFTVEVNSDNVFLFQ